MYTFVHLIMSSVSDRTPSILSTCLVFCPCIPLLPRRLPVSGPLLVCSLQHIVCGSVVHSLFRCLVSIFFLVALHAAMTMLCYDYASAMAAAGLVKKPCEPGQLRWPSYFPYKSFPDSNSLVARSQKKVQESCKLPSKDGF